MDKMQLAKWKREMEMQLTEVEKQITVLEKKRVVVKAKLGAVTTLLSPTEGITAIENYEVRDPVGAFIGDLKVNGWSVWKHGARGNHYGVNRGGQNVDLWIKFSKLSEVSGRYWFGVNPAYLENRNGGVILLLGTYQQYICLPFTKLREMLEGSKNTITGQKFVVRRESEKVELQPAGTGGKWINVTPYFNGEGLKAIGIN
jgi:hypothetical protein